MKMGRRAARQFAVLLCGLFVALVDAAALTGAYAQLEGLAGIPNFRDTRAERTQPPSIEGIRFTTSDDFPPFNFTDASGRLVGFNVDLARAICEELVVPCTIQARPFEDLLAAIADDRADAAIAGIAITVDIRRAVDFSDVYLRLPARFVVRQNELPDISADGLSGRGVAVVVDTSHEAFLRAFFHDAMIVSFENAEEARTALKEHEVDAFFGDGMQLAFWLEGSESENCCVFAGGPYLESAFFGQGLAIAVRPDRPDMVAAVNASLQAINAKGIFAELYLRYFPLSFY
ncbi:MAG: transporter substrate-binding domain-containing protein [Alphaproteobacteria bacterium]